MEQRVITKHIGTKYINFGTIAFFSWPILLCAIKFSSNLDSLSNNKQTFPDILSGKMGDLTYISRILCPSNEKERCEKRAIVKREAKLENE